MRRESDPSLDPTDPRAARWQRVELWLAAAALGWCAFRLARGIGPDPFYNSDCAVPILLMQGLGEGPFTLYYPLQDRYGMWPFLVARWLGLGTPEAFHVFSVLAWCSAVLPLWRVMGGPALAVLTLFAPVVLNHSVAWNFFQAGQPYLWQVLSLCWAWGACRAALSSERRASRGWGLVGFWAAGALATWISTLSVPLLLVVLVLEAVQARARPWRIAAPVVALGLAALTDGQLRRVYNAFCRRTFGQRFITPLQIDRGHLISNLAPVVASAWRQGVVVPFLLGAAVLPLPGRSRTERLNQLSLLALAVCPLPAYVVVSHFRSSDFAGRYFSLPAFWAVAAAVYGAVVLGALLAGQRRQAIHLVALAALVVTVPAAPRDPLADDRAAAARLVGPEPRVLLAGYWEVYVPASLAPAGALLPVGAESNLNRFPGTLAELRPGRKVLAPCALDRPDGTLEQRGALLRRTIDPPVSGTTGPWCLHAVERAAATTGTGR